ncbi:unnamed protein product [marine sediment metagenome]|uniref:Uncharacterized protein n=1 Tax=marine sediment metagenome TaxID=412755 RepID=X1R829_9ZZZZ
MKAEIEIKEKEEISKEKRLEQYLECESLLDQFFKQVNYCQTNCVNQPEEV